MSHHSNDNVKKIHKKYPKAIKNIEELANKHIKSKKLLNIYDRIYNAYNTFKNIEKDPNRKIKILNRIRTYLNNAIDIKKSIDDSDEYRISVIIYNHIIELLDELQCVIDMLQDNRMNITNDIKKFSNGNSISIKPNSPVRHTHRRYKPRNMITINETSNNFNKFRSIKQRAINKCNPKSTKKKVNR